MPRAVYADREDVKRILGLTGTTFADYDLDPNIATASRAMDELCNRQFDRDPTVEATRIYTPQSPTLIIIDDMVEIIQMESFLWGPGSTSRIWRNPDQPNPEFQLEPFNAIQDGWPYTRITLNMFAPATGFPSWAPASVRITAKWGWPALPDQVATSTRLLSIRLIKRIREAPFGVVMSNADIGTAIRIARTDPEIMSLLNNYVREKI